MKALPTIALLTAINCVFAVLGLFYRAPDLQITSRAPNIQTADYEIGPQDCNRTIESSGGQWTFFLPSALHFRDGCRVTVRNGDTWSGGRGKRLRGAFPNDFTSGKRILWPTATGTVEVVGRQWVTVARPFRPRLPDGDVQFYSDYRVDGGDTDNDCMAPGRGNACQTAAHVLYLPCNEFEFTGTDKLQTRFIVNMAKGVADRAWIHYACPSIPGANGGAHLVLDGQGSAELAAIGKDAISVAVNATLSIRHLAISSETGNCVRAEFGGQVFFAGGNTIKSCAGADFSANGAGSRVYILTDYVDEGRWSRHFEGTDGGVVVQPPQKRQSAAAGN